MRYFLAITALLFFASLASAQTNTFCPQGANCTYTGNNTHSGTENFTGSVTAGKVNGICILDGIQNATLAAAITCAGTSGVIEIPMFAVPSFTTATIPAGVTLRFDGPSCLNNSGTLTIAGSIVAPPTTQIFCGSGSLVINQGNVEALWFPGANLGVQVNNAALALNSAKVGNTKGAGKIHVAAGSYSVPLGVMSPQSDVIISCDENQSTAINFTGASGIGILFNVGSLTGSYNEWGTGIENCMLNGPGYPNGTGQAGTGIQLGDATHAPIGVQIRNSEINGFALGWNWGANSNAFGTKLDHTAFLLNTQDFVYNPNAGGGSENLELDHVIFAPSFSAVIANDVVIGSGSSITDIWFNNCSFDNGELVISNGSNVGLSKPHFEYGFNTTTPFVAITGGNANVVMLGPVFQYDPSSGAVPPEAILTTGGTLDVYSPVMVSNAASITNYLNATNSTTRVFNIMRQTNLGAATYSGGSHIECGTIGGACSYSMGSGNFSYTTSGTYFVAASSIIQFQGPGIDIVEGVLNPQANTLNIGERAADHMPIFSANGSAATQNFAQTVVLHTAYTNATTTFSTLSDGTRSASFSVAANTDYTISCKLLYQGSATTAGPKVQVTGPASPTAVMLSVDGGTGAAAYADAGATAFSSVVTAFGTLGAATTNFTLHIEVGVSNGANAGTVALQLAANGAGTLTVQPGSYCRIQ